MIVRDIFLSRRVLCEAFLLITCYKLVQEVVVELCTILRILVKPRGRFRGYTGWKSRFLSRQGRAGQSRCRELRLSDGCFGSGLAISKKRADLGVEQVVINLQVGVDALSPGPFCDEFIKDFCVYGFFGWLEFSIEVCEVVDFLDDPRTGCR